MHLGTWLKNFHLRKVDLGSKYQIGEPAEMLAANVLTSGSPDDPMCYPVLDLDFPCQLLESTNGNSHLVIQKQITREQYNKLLTTLMDIGLYDKGCYSNWLRAGFTGVRLPWITKTGVDSQQPPVEDDF
jgi:hypothetical protein